MSIFEDKVYKEMEWLEKVCEPIKFSHNDLLQQLPDRYEVNYDLLYSTGLRHSWGVSSIGAGDILSHLMKEKQIGMPNDYKLNRMVNECFDLEIIGNPIIDLEHCTLEGGQVFLIKKISCFEENQVMSLMAEHAEEVLGRLWHSGAPADRLNEMCELLGLDEARKSRSRKTKGRKIRDFVYTTMLENKWNIKDIELGKRVSNWIIEYLTHNNGAAFANFCKFKVMTHYDAPIYSIENEEKV